MWEFVDLLQGERLMNLLRLTANCPEMLPRDQASNHVTFASPVIVYPLVTGSFPSNLEASW